MHSWKDIFLFKGCRLYDKGRSNDAFDWFLKGAQVGDTGCMLWLGILYGESVRPDRHNQREIAWYKRAWRLKHISAANNLAIVYKNQRRYLLAERWFKTAIQLGDGDANLELANMYRSIHKHPKDIKQLLTDTIESDWVTPWSVEEAQRLLQDYI